MCVMIIVLYYFDMWLSISSPYIIDTAFLDIAQHICELFLCVSTFRNTIWSLLLFL